jgi:hypothetical protein
MERHLAIRMLEAVQSLSPALDEASQVTLEMADTEEAKQLRRHLGEIMVGPLVDIVMHIVKQYPDLDPDRRDSEGRFLPDSDQ